MPQPQQTDVPPTKTSATCNESSSTTTSAAPPSARPPGAPSTAIGAVVIAATASTSGHAEPDEVAQGLVHRAGTPGERAVVEADGRPGFGGPAAEHAVLAIGQTGEGDGVGDGDEPPAGRRVGEPQRVRGDVHEVADHADVDVVAGHRHATDRGLARRRLALGVPQVGDHRRPGVERGVGDIVGGIRVSQRDDDAGATAGGRSAPAHRATRGRGSSGRSARRRATGRRARRRAAATSPRGRAPRRSGDRNGPSRWTPSTRAPRGGRATTAAAVANAGRYRSGGAVGIVGSAAVTPVRAIAAAPRPNRLSSDVVKSAPAKPLTCRSTKPATAIRPPGAPGATPRRATRSPSTSTSPGTIRSPTTAAPTPKCLTVIACEARTPRRPCRREQFDTPIDVSC